MISQKLWGLVLMSATMLLREREAAWDALEQLTFKQAPPLHEVTRQLRTDALRAAARKAETSPESGNGC